MGADETVLARHTDKPWTFGFGCVYLGCWVKSHAVAGGRRQVAEIDGSWHYVALLGERNRFRLTSLAVLLGQGW